MRLATLILGTLVAISLMGCGGEPTPTATTIPTPLPTPTPRPTATPALITGTEAYPKFSVNSASPAGDLSPGKNTLVAVFNVTALGNGDITFKEGSLLWMMVNQHANDIRRTMDWVLKDGAGDTVSTTISSTRAGTLTYPLPFSFSKEFIVPTGATKQLYVYGDTSKFEDDGDAIQVWLDDNLLDPQLLWYVEDDDRAYGYPEIIFRGDIYAGSLVNPG